MAEPVYESLEAVAADVRSHGGCGFECCETATNLVPGEGDPRPDVVFVGEAPGAGEDKAGRPFVGRAGKLLDELLLCAGLARDSVYITNVVKARPPGNRDPKPAEVAHWMPVLQAELALISPLLVVPLGRHALAHFAPGLKITEVAGTLRFEQGQAVYPLLHPAAALRAPALRERLFADAGRLPGALEEAKRIALTSEPLVEG
ncbi:MAG: uracil-DNA glycosylase [Actinomycetota bacterium]|nr:uracil-DNA glycosylase [Actinomycetota bacterium]